MISLTGQTGFVVGLFVCAATPPGVYGGLWREIGEWAWYLTLRSQLTPSRPASMTVAFAWLEARAWAAARPSTS